MRRLDGAADRVIGRAADPLGVRPSPLSNDIGHSTHGGLVAGDESTTLREVARLSDPIGIVRDGPGTFHVIDPENQTIRTLRCPNE